MKTKCPVCGEQVEQGVRFCPACGSRQPEQQVAPTIMLPPPTVPPPDQGPEAVATPTLPVQPAPPPPPLVQPLPPPPPQGYNQQGYNTPPPPKGGFPWLPVVLGTVGLCLVVSLVGGFLALSALGQRVSAVFSSINSELAATPRIALAEATPEETETPLAEEDATPTEEPAEEPTATEEQAAEPTEEVLVPTEEVPAATPGVQGVGGALGNSAPTAVVAAEPTIDQAATAQVEQALVAAIQATAAAETNGASQIFRDEFVDNRNAWFIGRFDDSETNIIEGGVFKVIRDVRGSSFELYQPRAFTSFVADVDCLVVKGDLNASCGLVFGQKEDVGRWSFEVFNDYYRLSIIENGEATVLVEGDPAGIVKPNEPNSLRVVRRGSQINMYINGQFVQTASDERFPSGRIGVETSSYQKEGEPAAELWFDNFTIWEIK